MKSCFTGGLLTSAYAAPAIYARTLCAMSPARVKPFFWANASASSSNPRSMLIRTRAAPRPMRGRPPFCLALFQSNFIRRFRGLDFKRDFRIVQLLIDSFFLLGRKCGECLVGGWLFQFLHRSRLLSRFFWRFCRRRIQSENAEKYRANCTRLNCRSVTSRIESLWYKNLWERTHEPLSPMCVRDGVPGNDPSRRRQ